MAPFSRSLRQLGGKLAPSGKKAAVAGEINSSIAAFNAMYWPDVASSADPTAAQARVLVPKSGSTLFFSSVSGQDLVEALLDLYAEGKIDTAVVLHDRDKVSLPLERKSEVKLEITLDDYAGDLEPSLDLEPDVASEDSVALCTSTRGSALQGRSTWASFGMCVSRRFLASFVTLLCVRKKGDKYGTAKTPMSVCVLSRPSERWIAQEDAKKLSFL